MGKLGDISSVYTSKQGVVGACPLGMGEITLEILGLKYCLRMIILIDIHVVKPQTQSKISLGGNDGPSEERGMLIKLIRNSVIVLGFSIFIYAGLTWFSFTFIRLLEAGK